MKGVFQVLAFALVGAGHAADPAGPDEWRRGEGVVPVANITLEEAREKAWDQARLDALSRSSLEVIGATAMKIQEGPRGEIFSRLAQFVRTATRGRIVGVDTLFDGHEARAIPGSERRELVYRVAIRARVRPETGVPDPAFQVDLRLNKEVFRDGETLGMELSTTQDCYLTVFNLFANDSLLVVFPNEWLFDNRVQADRPRRIPPRGAGWDLPVGLLPGRDRDEEMLLAVATKDPVRFGGGEAGIRQALLALDEALLAINNWLVEIPAERRTQAMASYRVVR